MREAERASHWGQQQPSQSPDSNPYKAAYTASARTASAAFFQTRAPAHRRPSSPYPAAPTQPITDPSLSLSTTRTYRQPPAPAAPPCTATILPRQLQLLGDQGRSVRFHWSSASEFPLENHIFRSIHSTNARLSHFQPFPAISSHGFRGVICGVAELRNGRVATVLKLLV